MVNTSPASLKATKTAPRDMLLPLRAFRLFLFVSVISALVGVVNLIFGPQDAGVLSQSQIASTIATGTTAVFFIALAFIAYYFGRVLSTTFVAIVILYAIITGVVSFFDNIGLLLIVLVGFLSAGLIVHALPIAYFRSAFIFLGVLTLALFIYDTALAPPSRSSIPDFLYYLMAASTTFWVLVSLALIFYDFRYYSLQFKFIISVTILSLLSVVITTIVTSQAIRSALTDEIGAELHNIAEDRAFAIGEGLAREINILQTLALNPSLARNISRVNNTYVGRSQQEILAELRELNEQWRSDAGEIFFSEYLNNLAARELRTFIRTFPSNQEILVTDQYGALVASTNRPDRLLFINETWWRSSYRNNEGAVYLSEPLYNVNSQKFEISIAVPVYEEVLEDSEQVRNVIGILFAVYNIEDILVVLETSDATAVEEATQIEVDLILNRFTLNRFGGSLQISDLNATAEARRALQDPSTLYVYGEIETDPSFASQALVTSQAGLEAIDELNWVVFVHQPESAALSVISAQQRVQLFLGVGIILTAIVAATIVGQIVSRPVVELTEVATALGEGNLSARALVQSGDEIATLAETFNDMADRLRSSQQDLEAKVLERTKALEASSRVSRSLSTIIDRQKLVLEVVEQVKNSFKYYHVHVYLIDEEAQKLKMVGGSGEVGRIMLERGHSLALGQGLVGRAAETNMSIVAMDVSRTPGWRPNPLLPETKAEIAVPVALGDRVLGVLDVQNNLVNSFTQQDVDLLQSIASQIAIGLRNIEFYEQAQKNAQREALINEISQKIQSTTDVQSAMRVAVREIGSVLKAKQAVVRFSTDDEEHNGY